MAKKKLATELVPTGERPQMDEADEVPAGGKTKGFMEVGTEVVPGMRLRCICRGHTGTIGRLAWSPCGRFIASPSADKTIRIWDARNGDLLPGVDAYSDAIKDVYWLNSQSLVLTFAEPEDFRRHGQVYFSEPYRPYVPGKDAFAIWSTDDRQIHGTFGGLHPVMSCALSPNGKILAAGSTGQSIRLWDTSREMLTKRLLWRASGILALAWSSDSARLASGSIDGGIAIWDAVTGEFVLALEGHTDLIYSLSWTPSGRFLASGSGDRTVRIWDVHSGSQALVLEEHTDEVASVSFSADGRLLASVSAESGVRIWRTDSWQMVGKVAASAFAGRPKHPQVAFHPSHSVLAGHGGDAANLVLWDIDSDEIVEASVQTRSVLYASSKIVLIGESNVGKSCLAMRLAEDRYPSDNEHGTTHGMRFWPMDAADLHPSAKPPEGQRRDVVLWDFGGQDEYQLVHQMFLHDTTLALVLIDPTRGKVAMDEARDWNRRLEKHLGSRHAVKFLVGSKQDRTSRLVQRSALDELCHECGFAGYFETSAKTGRNIRRLRGAIADALDWDRLAKTSRPELFQRIRDDLDGRRRSGAVVVLVNDLALTMSRKEQWYLEKHFDDDVEKEAKRQQDFSAVTTVVDQLATQGMIVKTQLAGGDEALVLQLPLIERYAGSLIVAARNNPRGVPVLEERLLGSPKLPLPGMKRRDRVERLQEKIVLECIAELMIQHGICFRHDGLLVFPTLFPAVSAYGHSAEKIPHSISLFYDFTGAIDNIYASLVARLMISEEFGKGRLWPGRVEFDHPGHGVCGIRQIKRTGGLAHVDLFFAEETTEDRRNLFTRFVEDHLRQHGVEIREHQAIKCRGCGREIGEDIVQANIAAGENDVVCPYCRTHTLISEGVAKIRERDPQSDQKVYALRKKIEERTDKDAASAKKAVSKGEELADGHAAAREPIRLLHLSDLHFTGQMSPKNKLQWLLQDLHRAGGPFPPIETVEYLVISGDMTDKGGEEGFEMAREFVALLIKELKLSPLRCMLVPGNHDLQDLKTSYEWRDSAAGMDASRLVKQGDIYLVRNEKHYHLRLKKFSDAFYHKVMASEPYPLQIEEQGRAFLFPETRIQFLTLNSCWQIDQFHRKRSDVHPGAVANAIEQAEKEVADAVKRGDLKKGTPILRFAVWHHAAAGPEMMQDVSFIGNLRKAGVKVCLHGDVHEMRCELIGYKQADGQVRVIGAGSFGSPAEGRPESTPRLYNLLEIQPDLTSIRVHTRQQRKPDGAWEGFYEWPDPSGGPGRVPFFDIDLK